MQNPQTTFQYFIFSCFLIPIIFFTDTKQSLAAKNSPHDFTTISTPSGFSISLEIAETLDKRAKGLMFRKSLAADHGMLFIFPETGYWTFWMKNTLIPLDIIWMNESWKILHIESQVPICTKTDDSCPRYYSTQESRFVLEIQAGMAKQLDLSPGQHMSPSFSSSKQSNQPAP